MIKLIRKIKSCLVPQKSNGLTPIIITKQAYLNAKKHYQNAVETIVSKLKTNKKLTIKPLTKIDEKEMLFISVTGDPMGEVFSYRGTIYKGIRRSAKGDFISLYESGFYTLLIKEGFLVDFEITDYYSNDFELIVRPDQIHHVSSNFWNSYSLVKASIKLSLLKKICFDVGVILYDGHISNICCNGGKYTYFDLGSFIKYNGNNNVNSFSNCVNLYTIMLKQFSDSCLKYFGFQSTYFNLIDSYKYVQSIEIKHLYRTFLNFHKKHSSKQAVVFIKNCFKEYITEPEEIDLLFNKANYYDANIDFKTLPIIPDVYLFDSEKKTILYIGSNINFFLSLLKSIKKSKIIVISKSDEIASKMAHLGEDSINCEIYVLNAFVETPIYAYSEIVADYILVDDSDLKKYIQINHTILIQRLSKFGKYLYYYGSNIDFKKAVSNYEKFNKENDF